MSYLQVQPRIMWAPKKNVIDAVSTSAATTTLPTSTTSVETSSIDEDQDQVKSWNELISSLTYDNFSYLSFGVGPNLLLVSFVLVLVVISLFANIVHFYWTFHGISGKGILMSSVKWICISQV